MNKRLKLVLAGLVAICVIGGLIFAYVQMSKEREAEGEADQAIAGQSRVHTGTNGEAILTLDEAAQELIALKVQPVAAARINPELKGYGRVLDPAPLASLVADFTSTQAASAASQKEFERLKLLSAGRNASERALQAAQATAVRDQVALESIRTQLMLSWGKDLAEQTNLSAFIQSLVSLESVLVRIDLPSDEVITGFPSGARLVASSAENDSVPAQFIGAAPNAEPQIQGQGFFFLVKPNPKRLIPGRSVEGYLQIPGESLDGFIIPDSAVVRHATRGWIYLQTGAETFTRREIPLDHPMGNGWFVQKGIAPNQRIVVSGAATLLSEEQKQKIKLLD